jgi:hypothetical protein
VPFAHWITPEFMPKRFDTWFFLVAAPEDQVAVHDGREGVDSVWIRPADAIAEAEAGRRIIIFPTLLNVQKLGRSASVAEALAAAHREPIVTVLPRVFETAAGSVLRIPAEAGYGISRRPSRRSASASRAERDAASAGRPVRIPRPPHRARACPSPRRGRPSRGSPSRAASRRAPCRAASPLP